MYELMTLQQPFKGDNPLLIANRIVKCDYEPIPNGEFSEDLINAVAKCMTVDTKKRPNVVELCSIYTSMLLKQMDTLRIKEISLASKVKFLEKGRVTQFSKLSNTQAININSQYGASLPFNKQHEMSSKTGGFGAKSDHKKHK